MSAVNSNVTLLASAAKTATATYEPPSQNKDYSGVIVVIDCTAIVTAPSVVFTIQGYDEASGQWYDILASAAVTAVSTTRLQVHPAITASANAKSSDLLPRRWRVKATHSNANSITFSIGACLVK